MEWDEELKIQEFIGRKPLCAPAEFERNDLLICLGNVQADPEKAGGGKK